MLGQVQVHRLGALVGVAIDPGSGMAAYAITGLVGWHIYKVFTTQKNPQVRATAMVLAATVSVQVVLGIVALVYAAPMGLAAAHQIGAVAVLGAAVTHLHLLRFSASENKA